MGSRKELLPVIVYLTTRNFRAAELLSKFLKLQVAKWSRPKWRWSIK
jgi:hypothetical protein